MSTEANKDKTILYSESKRESFNFRDSVVQVHSSTHHLEPRVGADFVKVRGDTYYMHQARSLLIGGLLVQKKLDVTFDRKKAVEDALIVWRDRGR